MHSVGSVCSGIFGLIGLVLAGCGAPPQVAKAPSSADDSTNASAAPAPEANAAGDEPGEGLQFEDKGETEKTDRTPPPTPSYKPSGKGKQSSPSP